MNKDNKIILVGLDEIGKAVGAGKGTIKRWIWEEDFPALRCSDNIYRADPEAIRKWFNWRPSQSRAENSRKF